MTRAVAAPMGGEGRLSRDALIYGLGASGTQLLYVLFVPVFTRLFSPADFGILDFLVSINSLLGVTALLGMNSAIFYFLRQTDDSGQRRALAGTALIVSVVAGLLIAAAGAAAAAGLSSALLGQADYAVAVAMACLWVPANVAATLALDLLRIEFRPRAYALLAVGRSAIASILGVIAAGPLDLGVAGLLGAHAITTAAAAMVGLLLTRSSWTVAVDRASLRKLVPFGLPLVTFGVALWVIGFSDRFFVIQFLGPAASGVYSLASRGAGLVALVLFAFEAAWLPLAMAMAREPGHRQAYARVFRTVAAGLVGLAVLLSLFAREAVYVIATPEYVAGAAVVGVLALAQAAFGVGQVVAIGIQLGKRTGVLVVISALAATVNVVLTMWLVPIMGIAGAALPTLLAFAVSTGLIYRFAQRAYPVSYPVADGLLAFGIGLTAIVGGLLLDAGIPATVWLSTALLGKAAIAGLALGALWMIHRRSIAEARLAGRSVSPIRLVANAADER